MKIEQQLGLNSDLIKPYRNYIHTMNLGVKYNHFNTMKKEGIYISLTNTNSQLSSFPATESSDNIKLGLNQSIYDKKDLKKIIKHKLRQSIVYNDQDDNTKLHNLKNQITYNYGLGNYAK
ncbi:MAG: hypothetical protein ACNI22_09705 [Halarcobacter sp.]